MSSNLDTDRKQKIDEVMQSLQRARDVVRSREEFGVEGIHQFVEDVDGDWLENWTYEPCLTVRPTRKEPKQCLYLDLSQEKKIIQKKQYQWQFIG